MNPFALVTPCADCPFLKKGAIRLRAARIEEIVACEYPFYCHKTTRHDDEGDAIATNDSVHCAGILIFHEKTGGSTNAMRIGERLGLYDPTKLKGHKRVFDSLEQMLETAI